MVKKSAPKQSPSQRKQWLTNLQPSAVKADAGSRGSPRFRFVTDTNVLISAILYGGKPQRVLEHIITRQQLILSDYIVEEFVTYLKHIRPKAPQKWIRLMRQKLEFYCRDDAVVIDEEIRDINDIPILKLAISQQATIVTNDNDLLEYKSKSLVAIISVREYLEMFEATLPNKTYPPKDKR